MSAQPSPTRITSYNVCYTKLLRVSKLEVDCAAARVASFLDSMGTEMAAIALACGVPSVHGLCRDHLVALSPQAAEITGLPLAREGDMLA